MTAPKNYYMITNRAYDSITRQFGTSVAQDGALSFLSASVSSPTDWTLAASQDDWVEMVQQDLPQDDGPVTLLVHGYDVSYAKATTKVFPVYFSNIVSAGYPGVLIGFDWPSDAIGFFPPAAFQSAKQKAVTTGQLSFPLLAQVVSQINTSGKVSSSVICHSMGNYVMYNGATAFSRAPFNQVICAAAMLEEHAFNNISPPSPTYCQDIQQAAKRVTLYYSSHDDVLPMAQWPRYDDYQELGLHGPTYDSTLLSGVVGVDCSEVVNLANAQQADPGVSSPPVIHTSYFYIKEVLYDIQQTLAGVDAGSIADRSSTSNPAEFTMNPSWSPSKSR